MEKLDINKHIGKVCQEYRLKNNLTQSQVAELTGLEPRHISQKVKTQGDFHLSLSCVFYLR